MTTLRTTPNKGTGEFDDPRLKAFYCPEALEVFHSVCQKDQIWRLDPLDVHDIHEHSRAAFYELLERRPMPVGHILLLKGEAGSGKTHLMRAFRNHVHESRRGFCGYLQMTTATENYGRYILANLIDSLDDTYFELEGDRSSLVTLSNLVVEARSLLSSDELHRLRDEELSDDELANVTTDFADRFILSSGFEKLDVDLVRALVYLQRNDPRINARVLKYLRCENFDRRYLPGLEPRLHEHHPQEMVERLGQLMAALDGKRLVLLVDQLEEMANFDDQPQLAEMRFRRAMQSLCSVVGAVPGSIAVIACLEDFYEILASRLTKPVRDRIEQNPQPVRLEANRSGPEIEKLIARRLSELYRAARVENDDPLFPFTRPFLERLTGMRTRDVLEHCRRFRDGQLMPILDPDPVPISTNALPSQWNDFKGACATAVPESEEQQAELLAWAMEHCGGDLRPVREFTVDRDGREAVVAGAGGGSRRQRMAVCNRGTQGGGLTKQVQELLDHCGDYLPVIVRSAEFPKSPKSKVAMLLGDVVARGGIRVAVEDTQWRHMLAFQQFYRQHKHDHEFETWRQQERPLANLKVLTTILRLDQVEERTPDDIPEVSTDTYSLPAAAPPESGSPESQGPASQPTRSPLSAGRSNDLRKLPVTLEMQEITQHVAFLGGSGSGKTTVALHLIEQLALAGIPAILIDRKGDLCGYADETTWRAAGESPELVERRARLHDCLEVEVYTPGEPRGNALAIPITPPDMSTMNSMDQEMVAKVAATAIGGMMGYKATTASAQQIYALLYQAVLLLGQDPGIPVTIQNLADFVGNQDPALLNAINWFDPKLCRKLAQGLQAVEIQHRSLLSGDAQMLDIGRLLGMGSSRRTGKTRLSVISTKFLKDLAAVEFWIAQFLVAVERWMSRHPSDKLQCVLLFDEADIYLPATRQPATKLPMENLLKRARSAGLGMFLATQSPGDLDYKCRENIRSWFLGRIKEDTALRKLKAAFDGRSDLVNRLSGQETGQFILVRDGQPTPLLADRSVLKTHQLTEDRILEIARQSKR